MNNMTGEEVREEKKSPVERVGEVFGFLVAIQLFIWAALMLMVFIINWEGWFFGIRVEGLEAGIIFFAEFLVPVVILIFMIKSQLRSVLWAAAALAYFLFIFAGSAVSTYVLSGGENHFPFQAGVLLILPAACLAILLINSRGSTE